MEQFGCLNMETEVASAAAAFFLSNNLHEVFYWANELQDLNIMRHEAAAGKQKWKVYLVLYTLAFS